MRLNSCISILGLVAAAWAAPRPPKVDSDFAELDVHHTARSFEARSLDESLFTRGEHLDARLGLMYPDYLDVTYMTSHLPTSRPATPTEAKAAVEGLIKGAATKLKLKKKYHVIIDNTWGGSAKMVEFTFAHATCGGKCHGVAFGGHKGVITHSDGKTEIYDER